MIRMLITEREWRWWWRRRVIGASVVIIINLIALSGLIFGWGYHWPATREETIWRILTAIIQVVCLLWSVGILAVCILKLQNFKPKP